MVQAEPEMIEYCRDILENVSWKQGGHRQQVSYDTQFKVGNFYASTLTIREVRMRHRVSTFCRCFWFSFTESFRMIMTRHSKLW